MLNVCNKKNNYSLMCLLVLSLLFTSSVYLTNVYADDSIPELFNDVKISVNNITLDPIYENYYDSLQQDSLRVSSFLEINLDAFDSDKMILNIFDESILLEKDYIITKPDGFIWSGNANGWVSNSVMYVDVEEGVIKSSIIRLSDSSYQISYLGNGMNIISEIDRSKFPGWGDDVVSLSDDALSNTQPLSNSSLIVPTSSDPITQTILVGYTSAALALEPTIIQLIENSITDTNQSYQQSNLGIELEHVGTLEVPYVETGNYDIDLENLLNPVHVDFINLHEERDNLDADIVVLYTADATFCGAAPTTKAGDRSTAFAIAHSAIFCTENFVLAHEIGHLQGASHSPEIIATESNPRPLCTPTLISDCRTSYAHGNFFVNATDITNSWATIMSYNCTDPANPSNPPSSDCPTVQYWSSPLLFYQGEPTGDATERDNARILSETAYLVSTFGLKIPDWLKTVATFWVDDDITDEDYLNNINYMINNNYLGIPFDEPATPDEPPAIPEWIKNTAGWWADGTIDDATYATALTYLIEEGIIVLGEYRVLSVTMLFLESISSLVGISSDEFVTMASNALDPACQPDCFIPSVVNIDVGDTVTFANSKLNPTVIASGNPSDGTDGIFISGPIGTGLLYSTQFTEAGTFNYFDLVSPWMQGTIVVGDSSSNLFPIADAGDNQTVDENSLVVLYGSGIDPEGGLLLYSWIQTSGTLVSLSGSSFPGGISNSPTPFFTAPDVTSSETLTFQLTVKDDILQSDTDTVSITVNHVDDSVNTEPTADAGDDQILDEGTTVNLDGSGSFDPDGDPITYEWEQTQGITVTFDSTAQNPTFTAPEVNGITNLQFKLIVRDDSGFGSSPSYVTVTVNNVEPPPVNIAPTAVNDSFKILGTEPVNFDILFNDYDDDGDSISIVSVDITGTAGMVTNNGVDVTFDATEDIFGTTTFEYTITDGFLTDVGLVYVDVIDNSGGDDDALLYIQNPDITNNGNMGIRVAQIDDVNGDGYNDILASTDSSPSPNIVYLLSGNVNDGTGGTTIATFTNPAGAVDDGFGLGLVSFDSNKILIGAPGYDQSSSVSSSGAVYVYDSAGVLQTTLAPSELITNDNFGAAIDTSSDKIVIGVPGYDVTVSTSSASSALLGLSASAIEDFTITVDETGATIQDRLSDEQISISNVVIYNALDESIIEPALLPAFTLGKNSVSVSNALQDFGTFSINDTSSNLLLLVDEQTDTSYLFDTTSFSLLATTFGSAGAIFVYDAVTDSLAFKVENPFPESNDDFGTSIAIYNNNFIVGVPGYDILDDESNPEYWGSGAIYFLDGTDGSTIHFVPNPSADGGASDDFGESVGATDNYILVGSPDDDTSGSNWGAVYVIDPTTGDVVHHLPNPRDTAGDEMGSTIAGTSDKVIAGEPDDGYVHIFDAESGTFLATFEDPGNKFGSGVSAIGENILIGATHDALYFSGSVSVFSDNILVPNNPPVANNDTASATNDTPIIIDVLFNDDDADDDSLTIDSVNISGTMGDVINNINNVTFTADLNFNGTTTFSYKASDGNGELSNVGSVTVTVHDTIAPVISLIGDNPQTIELGAGYTELGATTDDGSDVIIDATEFADVIGTYSIYYDATDGINNAIQVIRTVDVVDTIAPVIYLIGNNPQTIEFGDGYTELGATTDDGSDVIIDATEFTDAVGSYSIYYDATDDSGNAAIQEIRTVDVVDTNVSPILDSIGNHTTDELVLLSFNATATDEDGDSLIFSLSNGTSGLVPTGAAITADGLFTWTPTESQDGLHTFDVTVTDGILSDSETIIITVNDISIPGELLLTINNPLSETDDNFGKSIATTLDGNIVIGMRYNDVDDINAAGSVGVFSGTTGELILLIDNPVPELRANFGSDVETTPDGKLLVSAPDGYHGLGKVHLFDVTTGELLLSLEDNTEVSNNGDNIAVTPDGNIVIGSVYDDTGAGDAGSVYLFNGTSGELLLTIPNPTPNTSGLFGSSVASTSNGDLLISTGGTDEINAVYLFNGTSGESLLTIHNPTSSMWIPSIAILPNDNFVIGDRYDEFIHLFNGTTGDLLLTIESPDDYNSIHLGWDIAITPDGNIFATTEFFEQPFSYENGIGLAHVFDGTTGELLSSIESPNDTIAPGRPQTAVTPDGKFVVSVPYENSSLFPPETHFLGEVYVFEGLS